MLGQCWGVWAQSWILHAQHAGAKNRVAHNQMSQPPRTRSMEGLHPPRTANTVKGLEIGARVLPGQRQQGQW